jgi:hypothetical protein
MLRVTTMRAILLGALLLAVCVSGAWGQFFDFEASRDKTSELEMMWRFHLGDDPDGTLGWAQPAFDDSGWALLRSDTPWSVQGYDRYSGFAWYRFKVRVPQDAEPLALCIPRIFTSYRLFADGKLIGDSGKMPPQGAYFYDLDHIFAIPVGPSTPERVVTLAIRVWHSPEYASSVGGGPHGTPILGGVAAVQGLKASRNWGRFWNATAGNVLMLVNLVAAFGGFFLFGMRPGDREYLWFGLYELLTGADHLVVDWPLFYPSPADILSALDAWMSAASWVLFLLFVFKILDGHRNWLFWSAIGTSLATVLFETALNLDWISVKTWETVWGIVLLPYFACILILLYRSALNGVPDARMLLAPVAICYATWFTRIAVWVLEDSGQAWIAPFAARFNRLASWPFPFSAQDLADMVMLLAVLAILPLRFARSRRDEERLAGEMESARTVQQVLVPAEVPEIPGFRIESIYKPAGQVGGDFFQIIPLASGSTVIVIGDVSGKGMPAAMTVALLVGTLRTLVHYTESPAEILSAMNQRMLARSRGGFTTCLVLRADTNGEMVVANAGHIAPFVNGEELAIENGLPLGLSGSTSYPEAKFAFNCGDQLTLMTDGVVEARRRDGELFGFERAAALSTARADQIAQVAQSFGQEDDITVLTLARDEVVLHV